MKKEIILVFAVIVTLFFLTYFKKEIVIKKWIKKENYQTVDEAKQEAAQSGQEKTAPEKSENK